MHHQCQAPVALLLLLVLHLYNTVAISAKGSLITTRFCVEPPSYTHNKRAMFGVLQAPLVLEVKVQFFFSHNITFSQLEHSWLYSEWNSPGSVHNRILRTALEKFDCKSSLIPRLSNTVTLGWAMWFALDKQFLTLICHLKPPSIVHTKAITL